MQNVRLGLFFFMGVALLYVAFSALIDDGVSHDRGYQLVAEFDDLGMLARNDTVRLAGVSIGRIAELELVEGRGRATLLIEQEVEIPRGSTAKLAAAGLLGGNYITLEYGDPSRGMLQDGDRIGTAPSVDINAILEQVSDLGGKLNSFADSFEKLDFSDMSELARNLNAFVVENRVNADSILANIEEVTRKLNEGEGALAQLLNDGAAYDELLATFERVQRATQEAEALLAEARSVMDDVRNGKGALATLIYDEEVAASLKSTAANFASFSANLNDGEGTIGKLLNDDELYEDIRSLVGKANRSLDSLGDSGPISAVGVAAQALF